MGIALEKGAETNVIRLEGVIGIECAAELKRALMEALEPGRQVKAALAGASCLDVTAVQMIWAARRAAEALGERFTIEGQMPEPLQAALADAGLKELLFTA